MHKAGFVAIIGKPNAGKSSLLNALLEFPLSIVSPKPQTTRHALLGILNGEGHQLCLLDTPGWLDRADDKLQSNLIRAAKIAAREDADALLLVVEPQRPNAETLASLKRLTSFGKPVVLAVNKSDLVKDNVGLERIVEAYRKELEISSSHIVSAKNGKALKGLLKDLLERLPESPPFFEGDGISDRWERYFVTEIVREKIFELYHEEVPHACAVMLEQFREEPGRKDRIILTIYVERPPQKGIVIGKGGMAIQKLRIHSHKAIEKFLGRKTELELFVKVRKNWRKDPGALKEFGY
ncbi:MAG: GTPase Era [Elusimicrobia bacterium CG1_02_63_36]|nr:MAG: GTPase Era [Elusimicrobia bacterium CG1_02_63_36]